jgi:hypothetical protein
MRWNLVDHDARDDFLTTLPRFVQGAGHDPGHNAPRREIRRSCLRDAARFGCAGAYLRRRWWPHNPIRTMIGSLV